MSRRQENDSPERQTEITRDFEAQLHKYARIKNSQSSRVREFLAIHEQQTRKAYADGVSTLNILKSINHADSRITVSYSFFVALFKKFIEGNGGGGHLLRRASPALKTAKPNHKGKKKRNSTINVPLHKDGTPDLKKAFGNPIAAQNKESLK